MSAKNRGIGLIGEDYEAMPSNWFAIFAEFLFWVLDVVFEFLFDCRDCSGMKAPAPEGRQNLAQGVSPG